VNVKLLLQRVEAAKQSEASQTARTSSFPMLQQPNSQKPNGQNLLHPFILFQS